jgi:iron(III) transport system substrate-binding protein
MLSLVASVIAHDGEQQAEQWARATVANMARPPRGGDTDQIKAVASGECAVALTNSYYLVRLMRSKKPEDRAVVDRIGVVWPNQANRGTHVNVSGGGMLRNAPHKEAARRFLEYLASDEAQAYFANGNNDWPVVKTAVARNAELESLGSFKSDKLTIAEIAARTPLAQRLVDRAGWR